MSSCPEEGTATEIETWTEVSLRWRFHCEENHLEKYLKETNKPGHPGSHNGLHCEELGRILESKNSLELCHLLRGQGLEGRPWDEWATRGSDALINMYHPIIQTKSAFNAVIMMLTAPEWRFKLTDCDVNVRYKVPFFFPAPQLCGSNQISFAYVRACVRTCL